MKKIFFSALALAFATASYAQSIEENSYVLDAKEDTTDVVTIKSIIKLKQNVMRRTNNSAHQKDVWSRRAFLDLTFVNEGLTPVSTANEDGQKLHDFVPITDVTDELNESFHNGGVAPKYKSDWGISLKNGKNYALHRNPIANVVSINLDYTWIDFSAIHFSEIKDPNGLDTIEKVENNTSLYGDSHYTPFNAEKFELSYGMSLGPSLTIDPFNYTKVPQLHYLKFNVYYHIGYQGSLLFMTYPSGDETNNMALDISHGWNYSYGASVNWKKFGIGIEHRSIPRKFWALDSKTYKNYRYKFDTNQTRLFLQFRF